MITPFLQPSTAMSWSLSGQHTPWGWPVCGTAACRQNHARQGEELTCVPGPNTGPASSWNSLRLSINLCVTCGMMCTAFSHRQAQNPRHAVRRAVLYGFCVVLLR